MIDEMSIKKATTWVKSEQKFVGYVDLGGKLGQDNEKVATSALVLMAVGLRKKWKMPVSFHFTAGLTAETLSVLIKQAITALSDIDVNVKAICDGRIEDKHCSNGPTRL